MLHSPRVWEIQRSHLLSTSAGAATGDQQQVALVFKCFSVLIEFLLFFSFFPQVSESKPPIVVTARCMEDRGGNTIRVIIPHMYKFGRYRTSQKCRASVNLLSPCFSILARLRKCSSYTRGFAGQEEQVLGRPLERYIVVWHWTLSWFCVGNCVCNWNLEEAASNLLLLPRGH